MNKQNYQPIQEVVVITAQVAVRPVIYADPQAGGCYTRDPITGALSLDKPKTQNA